MKRLTQLAVVIFLVSTAVTTQAQRDFSKVQITTTHVAGNVYMLQGSGGNIGVSAGPDGILIVDDQYAPLSDKILAALEDLDKGELKFILNTHFHGDHTGGNEILGKTAPIISHSNTRKRLLDKPKESWPVITFEDAGSVHFNGEEIKATHYPNGHTDGDLVIFFTGSNVVHMGDDFFADRFPFVDLNSGGSVRGLMKNIEMVISVISSDAKIIPGHGPLSTVNDLKEYFKMIVTSVETVEKGIASGASLEDIKTAGLPKMYESWGSGFINQDRWLETVYNSIRNQ